MLQNSSKPQNYNYEEKARSKSVIRNQKELGWCDRTIGFVTWEAREGRTEALFAWIWEDGEKSVGECEDRGLKIKRKGRLITTTILYPTADTAFAYVDIYS